MLAEELYMKEHAGRVLHTTWNPGTRDVLRLHLIFPRYVWGKRPPALVIINGKEYLPLARAQAILLAEAIDAVNAHGPVSEEERESGRGGQGLTEILQEALTRVRRFYPRRSIEQLAADLEIILGTVEDINRGRAVAIELGGLSLRDIAPYMTAPHRMDLMVSAMTKEGHWNCNQRCVHCYAAGQEMGQTRERSTEDWVRIIDRCYQAGIPQLTFTGGEPTMREDLPLLIGHARWFISRLNTNGIRLTEDYCQKLVLAELDHVQVTFYAADRRVHNRLVGGDHYDQTVRGIENALAAGLGISTNTPLCSLNADYIDTLRFLHEMGVRFVTVSGLIVTGNARGEASKASTLRRQELSRILWEACDFAYAHDMDLNFTSPGLADSETLRALGLDEPACGAGLSNMAVAPNGDVVPCQSWLSDRPLGNLLTDPWEKIWRDPKTRRIRRQSAGNLLCCPLSQRG